MISSSEANAPRTSAVSAAKHAGFLSRKKVRPVRVVAVVSEPAMIRISAFPISSFSVSLLALMIWLKKSARPRWPRSNLRLAFSTPRTLCVRASSSIAAGCAQRR